MKTIHKPGGSKAGIILMLLGLFAIAPATNAASSYLQELEAEAARTDDGETEAPQNTEQTPQWESNQPAADSETIASGLSLDEFEERLKQNFYGSYLFYSTLDDTEQQGVYEDYQGNNSIESIRESIKAHMKQ